MALAGPDGCKCRIPVCPVPFESRGNWGGFSLAAARVLISCSGILLSLRARPALTFRFARRYPE